MKKRRLSAAFVCAAMILGSFPAEALAETTGQVEEPEVTGEIEIDELMDQTWKTGLCSVQSLQTTRSAAAEQEILEEAEGLPSKIDLRDYNGKNYVTRIKSQNPYGTCWAFGGIAAAEVSILYDNDLGVPAGEENTNLNLSEKAVNWFAHHPITEDDVTNGLLPVSQLGEGYDFSVPEKNNSNIVYNSGGHGVEVAALFMSGRGPISEDQIVDGWQPFEYKGKHGWTGNNRNEDDEAQAARKEYYRKLFHDAYLKYFQDDATKDMICAKGYEDGMDFDEWFNDYFDQNWSTDFIRDQVYTYNEYAEFDDWSIPDSKEYHTYECEAVLKDAVSLPNPYGDPNEKNREYNAAGTEAVKLEISKGHAIQISYHADQSDPNDTVQEDGYMNLENWAQYVNVEGLDADHSVCIIGYDDNYPKENFTRVYQGKTVEGSTPPGDGAFIVKNSWGGITATDVEKADKDKEGTIIQWNTPDAGEWGIDNSGYFYLSYYDMSIFSLQAFTFYPYDDVPQDDVIAQYDLAGCQEYAALPNVEEYGNERMANVFSAEEDLLIHSIAFATNKPNTTASWQIYLNPEEGNPESGKPLLDTTASQEVFRYGGYHRIDLSEPVAVPKGNVYSVVIRECYEEDGESKNGVTFAINYNSLNVHEITLNARINPGESWYYSDQNGWKDASELKDEFEEKVWQVNVDLLGSEEALKVVPEGVKGVQVDNFPIKAYASIPEESLPCSEWVDGKWYDADGQQTYLPTGSWKSNKKGKWFADTSGWYPKNRWQKIDGAWYFFGKDGYLETDAYRDGYYLGSDGARSGEKQVPGWKQGDKGWYYMVGAKALRNTWKKIDGKWYFFKSSGYAAQNEFVKGYWIGGNCVQSDPVKYGWHKTAKGWWYGVSGGWYAKNATYVIDGVKYTFDANGYCR